MQFEISIENLKYSGNVVDFDLDFVALIELLECYLKVLNLKNYIISV